jgi:hypothetical protein
VKVVAALAEAVAADGAIVGEPLTAVSSGAAAPEAAA